MNETLIFFPNLVYIDPSFEIKEHVINFPIYHRLLKVTQISTSNQNMNYGKYFHSKDRIYCYSQGQKREGCYQHIF